MEGTLDLASVSSGSPSYETFLKVEILLLTSLHTPVRTVFTLS